MFTARRKIDENDEGDTQKSVENELEKYLALCQEINVRDPLLWWKTASLVRTSTVPCANPSARGGGRKFGK